ncbi:MAG: putative ABC transporter permease [Clostridia bacterium]|nr:putative ABC transporter permease [Clostridia bacterium]
MKARNVDTRVNFYEVILIFALGSVAGVVIEGVWSLVTLGMWEYHTALILGPFNIIYGFGAAAMALVGRYAKGLVGSFLIIGLTGALVEYLGSLFQERAFLSRSWDYSSQMGNIEGRVSLLSALAWGALGILFTRMILPPVLRLLRKIRPTRVKILAFSLLLFFAFNSLLTTLALTRWWERRGGLAAEGAIEEFLDESFSNERMRELFPNYVFTGTGSRANGFRAGISVLANVGVRVYGREREEK